MLLFFLFFFNRGLKLLVYEAHQRRGESELAVRVDDVEHSPEGLREGQMHLVEDNKPPLPLLVYEAFRY